MSFVLRTTTTTTSAPQNSVVVYYVSHHHHLHRGVVLTDGDKIVVGVVKLVVVAGNNKQRKQRKQRSPLKRSFSLLLFSLLLNIVVLRAFLFFSIYSVMRFTFFVYKKYSFLAPKIFLQIILKRDQSFFNFFYTRQMANEQMM